VENQTKKIIKVFRMDDVQEHRQHQAMHGQRQRILACDKLFECIFEVDTPDLNEIVKERWATPIHVINCFVICQT
jgi:hypothetical protein